MKINDKNREVLLSTKIGFEFEFYSELGINKVRSLLAKTLRKKVLIFEEVHSEFVPTDEIFKLEPDYSGGKKMIELITGPLDYIEAKLILLKVLKWIDENGETSERCSFQYNVSFNTKQYGHNFITHMNILKFILDFDEEGIYEEFPQRRNSVYAKSIKFITPKNKFFIENEEDFKNIAPENFLLPSTKYYGINFTKLTKGYLEFRYLGGRDYQKKPDTIIKIMNDSIILLYESIKEKSYTEDNLKKLGVIYNKHSNLIKAYKSYDEFKKRYPKIKLTVDLRTHRDVISMYYPNIRDKIFELISQSSLKVGFVNYDSDKGRIQVKDAKFNPCYKVENVDLIECRIKGNVDNCNIFSCEITDSNVESSNVIGSTNIYYSKVKDCYLTRDTTCENSYIYGVNSITIGEVVGGVFRSGNITSETILSPTTEVVQYKRIL